MVGWHPPFLRGPRSARRSAAIRSRWAWRPAHRCRRASFCGRAWRRNRSTAAAWAPTRWSCAGRWPRTSGSRGSRSAEPSPRCRRGRRTACTSRWSASSPSAGTSTGSSRVTRSARWVERVRRPRWRAFPGGCGSDWGRVSTSSTASSPPTAIWRPSASTSWCSWATTSTRAAGTPAGCAATPAPRHERSRSTAIGTPNTRRTPTCRICTPPFPGS